MFKKPVLDALMPWHVEQGGRWVWCGVCCEESANDGTRPVEVDLGESPKLIHHIPCQYQSPIYCATAMQWSEPAANKVLNAQQCNVDLSTGRAVSYLCY